MRLEGWLNLSQDKDLNNLKQSAAGSGRIAIVEKSLSAAYPGTNWNETENIEVMVWFAKLDEVFRRISVLPFYANHVTAENEQQLPEVWDYPDHDKFAIYHLLISTYHWQLEYVKNMDAYEAMALFQELLLSDQFDKEWQYNLSEKSSYYDKNSKRSVHVPLTRPQWMRSSQKKYILHINKVPDAAMPIGKVIKLNDELEANG